MKILMKARLPINSEQKFSFLTNPAPRDLPGFHGRRRLKLNEA
jgi:hypothetical protein